MSLEDENANERCIENLDSSRADSNSKLNNLLCCPFCGTEAISEDHDSNGWYIACGNDDCSFRPSDWFDGRRAAEASWNRRAT